MPNMDDDVSFDNVLDEESMDPSERPNLGTNNYSDEENTVGNNLNSDKRFSTKIGQDDEPWKGPTGMFEEFDEELSRVQRQESQGLLAVDDAKIRERITFEKLRDKDHMDDIIGSFSINNKLMYNEAKARDVCRREYYAQICSKDVKEKSRSPGQQKANNRASLLSRYKLKMSRDCDGYSVLYLRDRLADLQVRLEEVMGMHSSNGKVNIPFSCLPPIPPISPVLNNENKNLGNQRQEAAIDHAQSCIKNDTDDDDTDVYHGDVKHNYAATPKRRRIEQHKQTTKETDVTLVENKSRLRLGMEESKLHAFASIVLATELNQIDDAKI